MGLPLGIYSTRSRGILGKLLGTLGTMTAAGSVGAATGVAYNHITDPFKKLLAKVKPKVEEIVEFSKGNPTTASLNAKGDALKKFINNSEETNTINKWIKSNRYVAKRLGRVYQDIETMFKQRGE
jgi:hypothetical protein